MKITIQMTAHELIEKHLWEEYCRLTGTSEWAVNEGIITSGELLTLPDAIVEKLNVNNSSSR